MKKVGFILFALFFIAFVYIKTMPPSVLTGDGARFQILAHTGGIAHPPGYPFYIMASRLFCLFPIANPAFRVNLFSTVCSIALLFTVLYILLKKNMPTAIALAAISTLALSDVFWSLSIRAEVYPFYLLILACFVLFFILYLQRAKSLHLYLAAFLLGLYISNRPYMVLVTLLFFSLVIIRRRESLSARKIFHAGVLFLVPFAINFIYVMLVDKHQIGYNYLEFYNREFQILPAADSCAHVFRRARWMLFAEQFHGLLQINWNRFETGLWSFGKSLVKANFTLIGLFISILGAWRLLHKERDLSIILGAIFLNNIAYFLMSGAGDRITFILPAFFVICFCYAIGIYEIYVQLPRIRRLIYVLMIAVPVFLLAQNFVYVDRSMVHGHKTNAEKILARVPQDATLFLSWPISTTFLYLQMVEGQRNDIRIIPCHESNIQKYIDQHSTGHPVFFLEEIGNEILPVQ